MDIDSRDKAVARVVAMQRPCDWYPELTSDLAQIRRGLRRYPVVQQTIRWDTTT